MTPENAATIQRAVEVIADNAARRFAAGATMAEATDAAIAEFGERWPTLAGVVRELIFAAEMGKAVVR